MKSHVLKFTFSLFLGLNLYAIETYTVDELIVQALENSPNLKIALSNYKASISREDIASSAYLPTVDIQLSAIRSGRTDTPTTNILKENLLLGNISLQQLIYDFGKTSSNVNIFVLIPASKYFSERYS